MLVDKQEDVDLNPKLKQGDGDEVSPVTTAAAKVTCTSVSRTNCSSPTEHADGRNEGRGDDDDDDDDDGHRYGNFKHYYEYHTASRDRFKGVVPGSFLRLWQELQEPDTFTILDIGCNEGDLTVELLTLVQAELPVSVCCLAYGLDFDSVLLSAARERHAHVHNLQFFQVDVMAGENMKEFLMELEQEHISVSLVVCLRVSMWVHLNMGDEGLLRLLRLLGDAACHSALLLDPQKYSYYKKACSRNTKLGRPGFPYSLDDLSLSNRELPAYCLQFFNDKFKLSILMHKDIAKWGGTLLFLMKGAQSQQKGLK